METIFKIINLVWQYIKTVYAEPPKDLDSWKKTHYLAEALLREHYPDDSPERTLMKKILAAVLIYYEQTEWRSKKNGEIKTPKGYEV